MTRVELRALSKAMNKYTAQIEKIIAQAEDDGFQRGWQAARDALSAPVTKVKVAGSTLGKAQKKKRKKTKKEKPAKQDSLTIEERVLEAIQRLPGQTGAEIIRELGDANPRTVRTMLRRLRIAMRIGKVGEGWWIAK